MLDIKQIALSNMFLINRIGLYIIDYFILVFKRHLHHIFICYH